MWKLGHGLWQELGVVCKVAEWTAASHLRLVIIRNSRKKLLIFTFNSAARLPLFCGREMKPFIHFWLLSFWVQRHLHLDTVSEHLNIKNALPTSSGSQYMFEWSWKVHSLVLTSFTASPHHTFVPSFWNSQMKTSWFEHFRQLQIYTDANMWLFP